MLLLLLVCFRLFLSFSLGCFAYSYVLFLKILLVMEVVVGGGGFDFFVARLQCIILLLSIGLTGCFPTLFVSSAK